MKISNAFVILWLYVLLFYSGGDLITIASMCIFIKFGYELLKHGEDRDEVTQPTNDKDD